MNVQITNFRDLGGIKNKEGKTIKSKKLLRSGHLVNLDEETQRLLVEGFNLTRIIDFRRGFEISESPDTPIQEVEYVNLDLLGKMNAKNSSLADFAKLKSIEAVDKHMLGVYEDLILNPGAQEGFTEFMDYILANKEGATIFHCFAGKDRTGYASALLLLLLDVEKEEIYKDFLITNTERKQANDELVQHFREQGFNEEQLESLATALYVKEEYLDHTFKLIEKQFGTAENYAAECLNFDQVKLAELRNIYLTD
ncbi:tyrosine-protein phosphatase [Enterococcus plantarum]|uniref:Protein-tyrosine-phosphatase n=1 Tax=Enterococcus plantarum TaxID=1077675 RepID=A0A2W3Z6T0_9ENTE|nr:tyrosine-protein phosphatase [Enterococcus plantarum]MBO0465997.1 tyrosine-protein phosphatase [Enterococcus plantarum]PZL75728.1 protein-tyrosine-phosphatase [Enterococcus plantarum]